MKILLALDGLKLGFNKRMRSRQRPLKKNLVKKLKDEKILLMIYFGRDRSMNIISEC